MGMMIFMLKSQCRAFRWPNNLRARLYSPNSIIRGFWGQNCILCHLKYDCSELNFAMSIPLVVQT